MEGSEGRIVGVVAAGTALWLFVVVIIVMLAATDDDAKNEAAAEAAAVAGSSYGQGLNPEGIPAAYVPWLEKAGSICPEITPPLLAGQISVESGFKDQPPNASGAAGPGQWLVPAWSDWGIDGDGDGKTDLHSVPDALMSTGHRLCAELSTLQQLFPKKTNLVEMTLAAYHDGLAIVQSAGDVPASSLTKWYVAEIKKRAQDYTEPVPGGSAAGGGGWVEPVPKGWTTGAVFGQVGTWSWMGWHTGYDFAIAVGKPVYAAGPGRISEINPANGSWGNQIIIAHGPMQTSRGSRYISSTYNHLHSFTVKVGQIVKPGDLIGYVGMTGNTFGPHLHFEIHATTGTTFNWANPAPSDFLDPWKWLQSHSGPPAPAQPQSKNQLAAAVISEARKQLGKPYVFGANGPEAFDCSSLMIWAWREGSQGQINLPRTTFQQIKALPAVSKSKLLPGDLIFFQTGTQGGWDHVGLYLGDGKMIHAPNSNKPVEVADISTGYYADITSAGRRVPLKGQA